MPEHRDIVDDGDLHPIANWNPATVVARNALSVVAGDMGKIARQVDNGAIWRLADDSPMTWQFIGGAFPWRVVADAAMDGSTDDTTVLQAHIDAASAAGGGVVLLLAGTYKTTGLVLKDNVWLVGAHWRKTILYSTSNAKIISVSTTAFNGGVNNFTIKGDVAAGSSQIGFELNGNAEYWSPVVRDVWIQDCGGLGFSMGQYPFSPTLENIQVTNCAGYHFQFDCPIAPCITLRNSYAHTLRASGPCGFRIKRGRIVLENCNGIDNNPALSGSNWAVVGRKNGVDGDAADEGARLILKDCNVEQFYANGVLLYSYSNIGLHGRTGFAGGNSGSQKALMFDAAGDGSAYFAEHITHTYIEDTVDFADGVAAYANSQPIHANGHAPIQILGRGPGTGGGAPLTTYYNHDTSSAHKLPNAGGRKNILTVTGTTTIAEPGVTIIEVNNASAAAMDLTLPWGGWYQSGVDVIIVKDVGSNAGTYNITVKGGGGYGTITTMNVNGQALILTPDANTGTGAWRVISSYPEYKLITESVSGVAIAGTLSGQDIYTEGYSASPSAAAGFFRRRHRGTAGSPAAVQSGDALGYDQWQGQYDSTAGHRNTSAAITVAATENFDATHGGVTVEITAAPNASVDPFAKGVRLDPTNLSFEPKADESLDLGTDNFTWRDLKAMHVHSKTSTPGIAAGAGAGTGPTIQIAGSDGAFRVTLTTGTTPTANGVIFTVTFNRTWAATPRPIVAPANSNAASYMGATLTPFVDNATIATTSFDFKANSTALAGSTSYIWYFTVSAG